MRHVTPAALLSILLVVSLHGHAAAPDIAVVASEFVADEMPTPSCHATTIAESGGRLIAAWFGGKREGDPSVGIWVARHDGRRWGKPVEVATGEWPADGKRYPCWNPVLFQPKAGPLMLFYKVGPKPSSWWGMMMTSADNGATWSKPQKLPEGILGPIKNKPIELAGGTILSPSSTEHDGWRLHVEWSRDGGRSWDKTGPLNDKDVSAIQPSFLRLSDRTLGLVCRSKGAGKVLFATSGDMGRTWSSVTPLDVPNPNSGIDAVTLADGRHLMVYNDTPKGRTPLNVALSKDGRAWANVLALETDAGEYSYPAVIQTADGNLHITYTWKRQKVRHVVLDPAKLKWP
jgi:predicted neuraminidase